MTSTSRPRILTTNPMTPQEIARVQAVGELVSFPALQVPLPEHAAALATVDAALTNGVIGFSEAMFAACPRLRLVHCISAGADLIDFEAAKRRNIPVTSGKGTNAATVADHAMGLLLAVLRRIPKYDREVQAGIWDSGSAPPHLWGRKVGIFGLGEIGSRVARRAEAFEAEIAYTSSTAKPNLPWKFHADLLSLARAVSVLVVTAPETSSTKHIVNREVLAALGPDGFLVNVSRGGVVDTGALVEALKSGTIAGAGIDVTEEEPNPPAWAVGLQNLVMTPHVGGWSLDSRTAMMDKAISCLAGAVADLK